MFATVNNAEVTVCVKALCKTFVEHSAGGLYSWEKNVFFSQFGTMFAKIMCWISSLNVAYLLRVHILALRSGLDFQEIAPFCQVEVQGGKWQASGWKSQTRALCRWQCPEGPECSLF